MTIVVGTDSFCIQSPFPISVCMFKHHKMSTLFQSVIIIFTVLLVNILD